MITLSVLVILTLGFVISRLKTDRQQKTFMIDWQNWVIYLIVSILVTSAVIYWLYERHKHRKQLQEFQTDQIKSQLATLKSQINPHFLFNSFNTLISLIESDPKDAIVFVEKLSDFYRSMLEYRDTDVISLEEEMSILENYRFLLFQRYRQNLNLKVNVVDPKGFFIVPLTMQILTENAVKHNIVSASKPLEVNIYREGDNLIVCNNMQLRLTSEMSTHFGLKTLSRRYTSITGKEIRVERNEKEFCVTVPLRI